MKAESLEFQLAEKQLLSFEQHDDPVLRYHSAAQDCYQCEQWLQAGISALKWLARSEETARAADAEGLADFTSEVDEAIKGLYVRWLRQSESALPWITRVTQNGFSLDQLPEFEECSSQVRDWLEQHEIYEIGRRNLAEQTSGE